jgi:hypothetical protein
LQECPNDISATLNVAVTASFEPTYTTAAPTSFL